MKRLVIRMSGSRDKPIRINIRPGTTSRDILAHLELGGYVLVPASDPAQELLPEADVYRETREGEHLIALTRLEAADRYIYNLACRAGEG